MKNIYFVLCLFFYATSFAQNPLIIKTVGGTNAEPESGTDAYRSGHTWNGKVFYQAKGILPGINLAVTDGTAAGTVFIKNIGTSGSAVNAGISQMVPAQNFMYISALTSPDYSTIKYELWRSDGTANGTLLIKSFDLTTASQVMPITNFASAGSQRITSVVGDVLYFSGYDAVNGSELWKSDGTPAGTVLIKDIRAGSSSSSPQSFCKVGSKILFTAADKFGYGDLWQTDGTEAGTFVLKDFSPNNNAFGTSSGIGSALYKGKMYFYASESATGTEVWSSDGTEAGTKILIDANPGAASSLPGTGQSITFMQDSNYLYFVTRANDSSPYHVWRTDGTVSGTIQLTTAANAVYSYPGITNGLNAYPTANGIYFFSYADSLYKTNGTVAGTMRVDKKLYIPRALIAYKNAAWFTARASNQSDNEVWRSDGLAGNTNKALDIYPGYINGMGYSSNAYGYFELNNYLYFFANNASGKHLFRYNGDMTFNNSVAGGNWKDSANWNSMMPPGITDTAYINTGLTANVAGTKAYAGTLMMQNGSSVNLTGTTDSLFINNSLQGTKATGNGTIVINNFNGDTARLTSAFTANNLNVNGMASINSNLTINNNLNLTGNARLTVNNSNVILNGTSSGITNAVNNYIVTNGFGKLQIQNIGTGGRIGSVVFPIGSANNYNPVTLGNSGTMDMFGARTEPGININYSGETPTGSSYATGAVNNTWYITESTPGGSNANITLQWNGLQELPGFNRTQSQFGHYIAGSWQLGKAAAASGPNPYTFTANGITGFSPFAIFNAGATLPVSYARLSVTMTTKGQYLQWKIISEDGAKIDVERSFDGAQFTTLNSQDFIANGQYTDAEKTGNSKLYYRLKIVSRDGKIKYTNIVYIGITDKMKVSIYPTIFHTQLTVQNNSGKVQNLQLFQTDGKLLVNHLIVTGTNIISISNLGPGVYFYKISDGINISQGQIIKQ